MVAVSDEGFRHIPLVKILVGTIAAIVAATVANVIAYYIGNAVGAFPDDFRFDAPGGESSMGVGNVILTTVMYLALGGIVFAIISRLSRCPVPGYSGTSPPSPSCSRSSRRSRSKTRLAT